ncbi:MAG TPA: hypothetical protein VF221_17260 [Chloroflexota bacterium]
MNVVLATSTGGFTLTLHQGFARAFLIYSVLLGLWGLLLFVLGRNPSGGYLGALVIDEGLAVVQGIVGLVLRVQGHSPHDPLHYLYGVVAVISLPAAYYLSDGATTRRDSLYFGIACLFLVGVAIRGIVTGSG